jgi:hypothetical protein
MKYNDKSTERWQRKQLENDGSKSDRAIRRELKRNLEKFRVRVCSHVDSDWWDSFTPSEQKSIYDSWINNGITYWSNSSTTIYQKESTDFSAWIKQKYKEVKPDKSTFRDKKIEKILNG